MKLGEALAKRAELQSRLGQVRDRLRVSALIQEGDQPPEDPAPLLAELDQIADELEHLISDINRTNAKTRLPSGATLTEALAHRDVLGVKYSALKAVADATIQQQARYSRSEIRLVRTFDVACVRKRVDSLAREQRQLDVEIQAANWTVELNETHD
ncbi:MAG TPA: DIP1984 family protein [Solirubrobacteraceae bacterium]|nr:DIP1984 family protein [Solirubrobacteraceae bacterium]